MDIYSILLVSCFLGSGALHSSGVLLLSHLLMFNVYSITHNPNTNKPPLLNMYIHPYPYPYPHTYPHTYPYPLSNPCAGIRLLGKFTEESFLKLDRCIELLLQHRTQLLQTEEALAQELQQLATAAEKGDIDKLELFEVSLYL